MDTKDLISFNRVYQLQNLSAAARSLYISPQGLSKTMQKMEREIGTSLFVRTSSGMKPTVAGDRLYQCSRNIIDQLSNISNGNFNCRSCFNVPCTGASMRILSKGFVQRMKALYPDIDLHLFESADTYIDKLLTERDAEIAIMQAPVNPVHYTFIPLIRYPICVMTNKSDPLSAKKFLTLNDLCGMSVWFLGGSSFHSFRNRAEFFRAAGIDLIETLDLDHLLRSVDNNAEIAITIDFPDYAVDFQNIRKIPLINKENQDMSIWEIGITYQKNSNLSLSAQKFILCAKDFFGNSSSHNVS